MKKLKTLFLSMIVMLLSCNQNTDNQYFKGDIAVVNKKELMKKEIKSTTLSFEQAPPNGIIAVYDSLMICWSPYLTDAFFQIFNVDTGKDLGVYCRRGRGPEESVSLGCIFQLYKKGDDLMTMLYAANEEKLFEWNITQSVKQGKTVYDRVVKSENYRVFSLYNISEDIMFMYKPAEETSTGFTTPIYERRTISNNELLKSYSIYQSDELEYNGELSSPLYSWTALHPDGSKVVEVMNNLPQISIIDIKTGSVINRRVEDDYNFSKLELKRNNQRVFYNYVHADGEYIYATYWGKAQWNDRYGSTLPTFNTIHIYDWGGNLKYEITTDKSYFRAWSDPVKHRLYTMDVSNDEVSYFELSLLK